VKRFVTVLAALAAASALRASDAPPPKTDEAPPPKTADAPPPNTEASAPPKHRLGGGFKGSAVGTSPGGSAPARKPVAAPKRTGPALVIDNKMVQGASGQTSAASPAAPPPPPPAPAASSPAPPASVEMPKIVDLQGHDEAYWRAKAAATRDAVRKAQDALAAAEADEKRDENDFYSWDDGQYRDNVIKPAWDRAKEEAARARENLAAAQKDLEGLEDEARRAGAYPGWIR
jgi:hypothetical protein